MFFFGQKKNTIPFFFFFFFLHHYLQIHSFCEENGTFCVAYFNIIKGELVCPVVVHVLLQVPVQVLEHKGQGFLRVYYVVEGN